MTIKKTIPTEHGDVTSHIEIEHTDNGQVVLHITSALDEATHKHTVTVGAEDGKDSVSALPQEDLQKTLQDHIDKVRATAAEILVGRARVKKISALLQ